MLHVHRSERADHLADLLADILAEPLGDPLATEVVAVPTRGVERWITQRLAHRLGCSADRDDGVAANIGFPFPGTLVGAAVAAATGVDPGKDPWSPERAVWPLLAVIDGHFGDPDLKPLVEHLSAASPAREDAAAARFATARHLVDLFDRYGVHRPEMIRQWSDAEPGALSDLGRHVWQAHLWRLLRDRIGVASPAERLQQAVDRLALEPEIIEAPDRLSLFGLTRLPASYLAVLRAIAAAREVHLFLLHPSGTLWDEVAALPPGRPDVRRDEDPTESLAANALLRSWGRDAREMQLVLSAHGAVTGDYRRVEDDAPTNLLQLLQSGVRRNSTLPPFPAPGVIDDRPLLELSDTSIRLHSCHGRFRQVEVMREAILHILASDPTIEARDVIVMCPDVEAFAPLVEAAFGCGDNADSHDRAQQLRVRLADRSLRQTNPLLGIAATLLELAEGRMSASQVLDLAGRDPVRRRFRLTEEDLTQIESWVAGMGARWGADAAHRSAWKLGAVRDNTWESGLDRLLLGVAMAEDDFRLFGETLPLDDVPSTSVDLAGRFAEYVTRLAVCLRELTGRRPVGEWCTILAGATESLAAPAGGESWQSLQMRRLFEDAIAETGEEDSPLTVQEARALLAHRLRGMPTRANFRTGDLTVCTLVPMRSVPHRVVCLLGLDDGAFPRHPERDGDDVVAADPRVGDRDARSEDRQLLLDALLAATDHLVISYSGRDERTNRPRPPAVPIAELLDAIDRTVRPPDGADRPRDAVVVEHPLQAFDPRNFMPGELTGDCPWGFGELELAGAKSWAVRSDTDNRFLDAPLPPLDSDVVNLESLVRFFRHPAQSLLRERLGIYLSGEIQEPRDSLPIDLDGLEKWGAGDRILRALLRGGAVEEAALAERARGLLPPGTLADEVLGEICSTADLLVDALEAVVPTIAVRGADTLESVDVNVRLPGGRVLLGTVPGVHEGTIVNAIYSKLGPRQRLEAWIRLLAMAACRPEVRPSSVTVGRSPAGRGRPVLISRMGGMPAELQRCQEEAKVLLSMLVELYDRGMTEPLPLFCATSAAWAEAQHKGGDPTREAMKAWEENRFDPECDEEAHRIVLGGKVTFNALLEDVPRSGESGEGWDPREASRFGRIATRVWAPILSHETLETR